MGSVSSVPQYLTKVGLDDGSQHTQLLIGTLNAIYWVGVAIGALCIGWLSDKIGRRRALMTSLTLAVVIIPIFTSLQNFAWAITLRFLNGIAVGSVDSVGLNWTAETADHKHRGLSIGLELVCAPTAASIAYFMVYALSQRTDSDLAWRLPIAFQLVFVFMILSVVWLLPESPRWLVKVGLLDEARDVLSVLKGHGRAEQQDSSAAAVESDLRQIVQALENERADKASTTYWRMFTAKDSLNTRRRSWSAFFVQLSTQFMIGAGLVSGYGILLFETGGFSSDLAALLTGGAILTQGVFGIPGALLADKMGRRIALWGFALLGAVLLAAIGVCGYFVAKHADNVALAQPFGTAIITLVYVFSAEFGVSWCRFKLFLEIVCSIANIYLSMGPLHLPVRNLPSSIAISWQLHWYLRLCMLVFSCQHGQPILICRSWLQVAIPYCWPQFACRNRLLSVHA